MPVYNHILKNKKNCFLVKSNKVEDWITTINYIFKNYNRLDHIRKSAKQTAKFYNWNKKSTKCNFIFKIFTKKKIYYWGPFIDNVATIKAILNSAY
ncbi:hypothetical protein ABXT43_00955 [Candidatus Pelagibacter sp. Uisw_114]